MSDHILKRLRLSDVAPDEIERLRAERDDAKKDIKLMFESNQALAEEIDALLVRAEAAEAERDAAVARAEKAEAECDADILLAKEISDIALIFGCDPDGETVLECVLDMKAERDAMREERVSILVEIADALTTAIRKERWDIVIHIRDAVKETNRV